MAIIVTKTQGEVAVAFPYNADYVSKIKEVPGRRWVPERKIWTVPVASLSMLLTKFDGHYRLVGEFPELVEMAKAGATQEKVSDTLMVDYKFKTEPLKHQIQAFNMGISRNVMLNADDQGLGKTKETIDVLEYRANKGQINRVLIVAKASLKYNWLQEIEKHGYRTAAVIDGKNGEEKINSFRQAILSGAFYIIVNYEQLREATKELINSTKAADQLGYLIASTPWDAVVLDECQKVKNHKSGMGKAIHSLKATYRYALTGTPIINRPEEMFNVLKWFGMERRGYWSFIKEYCYLGGYTGWEVIGYQPGATQRMSEVLRSNMLRRMKKDVLDLPEKMYRTVKVTLGAEQRRIYNKVKAELVAEIFGEDGSKKIGGTMIALTKILRLKQAADSLELLGGKAISAKMDTLKDLVEEIVEAEQKVIIFTQFRGMYDAIKRELQDYGVTGIDGSMDAEKRMDAVNSFQNNRNIKVFVGMAQACREGLTLTAAQNVIFVDKEWAPAYVAQAEDRAYRIGQKNSVLITYLIAENTIDEAIEDLLKEKQNIFNAIVEGDEQAQLTADVIKRLLV
jgi:SNF2 family DNA or RNA helicase